MLETIAMWGGIAGIVVALFAIIILFLTKQSVNNLLNKDSFLTVEGFELKEKAITSAFAIADEIAEKGDLVKSNLEFSKKAKLCYNELLCVLTDVRIADEFYNIAIELEIKPSEARIAQFKLMCRKDIGLKTNKSNAIKRALQKQKHQNAPVQNFQMPQQPIQQQPLQYAQPQVQTTQPVQQPAVQPMQQPRPIQQPTQMARPVQPAQVVRPTQPVQPQRVVQQPTAQATRMVKPKTDN